MTYPFIDKIIEYHDHSCKFSYSELVAFNNICEELLDNIMDDDNPIDNLTKRQSYYTKSLFAIQMSVSNTIRDYSVFNTLEKTKLELKFPDNKKAIKEIYRHFDIMSEIVLRGGLLNYYNSGDTVRHKDLILSITENRYIYLGSYYEKYIEERAIEGDLKSQFVLYSESLFWTRDYDTLPFDKESMYSNLFNNSYYKEVLNEVKSIMDSKSRFDLVNCIKKYPDNNLLLLTDNKYQYLTPLFIKAKAYSDINREIDVKEI
jgi:hypothetical protein